MPRITREERGARLGKVYQAVVAYKRENDGCSPSMRELAMLTGISSVSVVHSLLKELASHDVILMGGAPRSGRDIQVVGGRWEVTFESADAEEEDA